MQKERERLYSRRKVWRVVEQRGKNFSAIGVPGEQEGQRLSHESYLDLKQTMKFSSPRFWAEKEENI